MFLTTLTETAIPSKKVFLFFSRKAVEDLLSAKPVANVKIKKGIEPDTVCYTAERTIHYRDIPISFGEA